MSTLSSRCHLTFTFMNLLQVAVILSGLLHIVSLHRPVYTLQLPAQFDKPFVPISTINCCISVLQILMNVLPILTSVIPPRSASILRGDIPVPALKATGC